MNTIEAVSAEECLAKNRQFCRAADVHPAWPMTTETVVEVLRSGAGYDVSVAWLHSLVARGWLGQMHRRSGGFAWSPEHILQAAQQAEYFRRWVPMDERHMHKMSASELADAQAVAGAHFDKGFDPLRA